MKRTSGGNGSVTIFESVLCRIDEAVGSLTRPKVAGSVRLGAPHEYTESLLSEILGKFAQAYPEVMLDVTCDLSKNLLLRQEKGEFELVIALHDDPDAAGGAKVVTEPLVWITSLDHDCYQLSPLPPVVAPPPCIYRSRVLEILCRLERQSRIAYTGSSYGGIIAAVRAGLGVSLLAASTMPEGVRALDERESFPLMGELEVRLHLRQEGVTETVRCLADFVCRSFD